MSGDYYLIRGGLEGRERLRMVARVMRPGTLAVLERAGLTAGMRCLDVGCGGGDVTFDLASYVGPTGHVVGVDIDPVKVGLARADADRLEVRNVEFRVGDVTEDLGQDEYDLVFARFVLWTLPDPTAALGRMVAALRPGGRLVVEDIDLSASDCWPATTAMARYLEVFTRTARLMGGDADFGRRVPGALLDAGLVDVRPSVVQPAGLEGEVKVLHPLSLENIKAAVVRHAVAEADEIDRLTDELYALARDPRTFMFCPRVVQAFGDKPAADRAGSTAHSSSSAASSHSDSTSSRSAATWSSSAESSARRA